jgi:DNA-binding MarR family transcriptional regulator
MERADKLEELRRLFKQDEVTSWRSLVITYRMIFAILESALQKMDCTGSRLQVLMALHFEGPMVPVRLANRMMVTRGNISTLLKRMQDEGLIEPSVTKGTKSRPAFALTEAGLDLLLEIYPDHAANICKLMPVLDREMINSLHAIQDKIYKKYKIGVPIARR